MTSNFLSLALTDIVAALLAAGAVVLLVRIRPPRRAEIPADASQDTRETVSVSSGGGGDRGRGPGRRTDAPAGSDHDDHTRDTRRDVVLAYAPYLIIILLFSIQQIPVVDDALGATTTKFNWPGLNVVTEAGKPVSTQTFTLNWLEAAGTILLIAGILTAIVLRLRPASPSPPTGARSCSCARRSSPSWRCWPWPTS